MSTSKAERRSLILKEILLEKEFPENLIDNSKRISKTLGFCELGNTLADLVSQLLLTSKENEECFNLIIKALNTSLDSIEKSKS